MNSWNSWNLRAFPPAVKRRLAFLEIRQNSFRSTGGLSRLSPEIGAARR
jgi:hypothetical protein